MRLVFSLLLLACLPVNAATYYVATNGDNSADGSPANPWLTISNATRNAVAGDTVIVKEGVYNEFFQTTHDGTPGNPITFTGVRGSDGSWLTIIDPSTDISNGWVMAPEIGSGVYARTNSFTVQEMTINHQRLAYVWTNGDMSSDISGAFYNSGLTMGVQFLQLASNAVLQTGMSRSLVNFWDGIQALYGNTNNTVSEIVYLKFADGRDPNGLNIQASPSSTAVKFQNAYNILSNFWVRGGNNVITIQTLSAHHNTIASNYVTTGYAKVNLTSGTYNNLIQNNEITTDYFGYNDPGAYDGGVGYGYVVREELYLVSKHLMGNSTSHDEGVYLNGAGSNNVINANHIYRSMGSAVEMPGGVAATGTEICSNNIAQHPSCGITPTGPQIGTLIHDNLLSDCNSQIRCHALDSTSTTNRLVYIYRNTFWLPTGVGNHIFTFSYGSGPIPIYPQFWIHHNTFSGGKGMLGDNSNSYVSGGLPGFHFLNNIASTCPYIANNTTIQLITNATMIGLFDYNYVTAPFPTIPTASLAAWWGGHDITNSVSVWTNVQGMSFVPPSGCGAIDAAIDTSSAFTVGPNTYPALPDSAVRNGSAWDIGAFEWQPGVANIGIATFY